MGTQYWANVAWQENANANITNGKRTLGHYIQFVWENLKVPIIVFLEIPHRSNFKPKCKEIFAKCFICYLYISYKNLHRHMKTLGYAVVSRCA